MTAASRSTFLGAAIFAGAAVVAALAATLIHGVPHPSRPLADVIWVRSGLCVAAGVSAALSFALIRFFDWRLRLGPLLGRAFVVGCSTVVVGHLLIGLLYGLSVLVANVVFADPRFWVSGHVPIAAFGMTVFSAIYGGYFTFPLGIAAAVLVE